MYAIADSVKGIWKICAVITENPGNLPGISLIYVMHAVYGLSQEWACYGVAVMLAKLVH